MHRSAQARWRELESNAHLPEVQEMIREEIQNRTIRVRPKPGGGLCIVPIEMTDDEDLREMEAPAAQAQDETGPLTRSVRRR
jgi:hypothetical protein